MIKTQNTQG